LPCVAHGIHPRATFIRRKVAGHSLDAQLRKHLAQSGCDMVGGGDKPAEHDRVGAFGNERLEHLHRGVELRVGDRGEMLGLLYKRRKRIALVEPGRRLDIDRIRLVCIVVEHLLFKPVRIGGETVAKRARGSRGRTADAAHQGERAQNASRRRRRSGPAPSTTPRQ
jgi:hypothetical protein